MKRKLEHTAKASGESQTKIVKNAVAEKLAIDEIAKVEQNTKIPSWVPDGKCVALVRGVVASVGDSVSEVVSDALTKFPDDAIHVTRKGKPIKAVHYAFLAQSELSVGNTQRSAKRIIQSFQRQSPERRGLSLLHLLTQEQVLRS